MSSIDHLVELKTRALIVALLAKHLLPSPEDPGLNSQPLAVFKEYFFPVDSEGTRGQELPFYKKVLE